MYAQHYCITTYSVLKQTMRAGGGNVTKTQAEDVSLSALFLLDASKKVDCEFNAHRSTAHTVRDANKDILKLASTLLEKKIIDEMLDGAPLPLLIYLLLAIRKLLPPLG